MPLWMASGRRQGEAGAEDLVDGSGEVALQAPGGPALEVLLGGGIPAQAGEHRPKQGGIGLPVAAAVKPAAADLSGRRLVRGWPRTSSEGRLTPLPVGVVPGCAEQGGRRVRPDALELQQSRHCLLDQAGRLLQGILDFRVEVLDAPCQSAQGVDDGRPGSPEPVLCERDAGEDRRVGPSSPNGGLVDAGMRHQCR